MDPESAYLPRLKSYMPLIAILLFVGFGGLFLLLNLTEPVVPARWMFYVLVVMGVTGLALPAVVFLYFRFPSGHVPSQGVIIRQSLWAGVYVSLMIWLRQGQVFNLGDIGRWPCRTIALQQSFRQDRQDRRDHFERILSIR